MYIQYIYNYIYISITIEYIYIYRTAAHQSGSRSALWLG